MHVRRARPLLGTRVEVQAAAASPEALNGAVDAAFAEIERIHQLMSYQDPASDLSRLNRHALTAAQAVDAHTYAVLAAALRFAELSDGAFDPCVAGCLEEWGYLPRQASSTTPPEQALGSWRDVELLNDQRVRYHRPLRLDLGGIAKGYAVDCAVNALRLAGAMEIVVNAGGDLRVAGARTWNIPLRHPLSPDHTAHAVPLCNAALATSAAYFTRRRRPADRRPADEVSALADPISRAPYLGSHSVSVRAADCMTADALTKVVLFAATERAEGALSACDALAFIQGAAPDLTSGWPRSRRGPAGISP